MSGQTPGAEDTIKYTKESLAGLRDVWLGVAQARIAKVAVALEQFAEKLPPPLKRKVSPPTTPETTTSSTSAANAPS